MPAFSWLSDVMSWVRTDDTDDTSDMDPQRLLMLRCVAPVEPFRGGANEGK